MFVFRNGHNNDRLPEKAIHFFVRHRGVKNFSCEKFENLVIVCSEIAILVKQNQKIPMVQQFQSECLVDVSHVCAC